MMGIGFAEFMVIGVVALLVFGPDRLPDFARQAGRMVRQVRAMAEGAKGQLREQMGPDFDDIDWRQYDPRQYDPRRIVREALLDPNPYDGDSTSATYEPPPGSDGGKAGGAGLDALLAERGIDATTFDDWREIEKAEESQARAVG